MTSWSWVGITAGGLLLAFILVQAAPAEEAWVQETFSDFRQGEAEDGGVNLYVTAQGSVRSIYTFDYNQDGANDVLFVNAHNTDYAPPTYIYMNTSEGLDLRYRWALLNDGTASGVVADLNRNGKADIVLTGASNGMNRMALDAYIYYGTERGFVPTERMKLPTHFSYSVAAGDIDGNGWLDLVFTQRGQPLIVYWNENGRFNPNRHTLLETAGSYVQLVDLDGDSQLDLVVVSDDRLVILPGTGRGFDESAATTLEVPNASRFCISDLDADGHLDLVVAATTPAPAGKSSIIWGGPNGFDRRPRTELPTTRATGCAVADFNQDGFLDLAFANQAGEDFAQGDIGSVIYWGGSQGYSVDRRTELPTEWPTQVVAGDLNEDGYPDLVFVNQMNEFSMDTRSFVYWGGKDGFQPENRIEILSHGALDAGIADVDNDGRPDLIVYNAMAGTNSSQDSVIYWNDGQGGFSTERVTNLKTWASIGSVAADLNQSGYVDLVIPNSHENALWRPDQSSSIFWGGPKGFSNENRQDLQTITALTVNAADFNRDGYLDLLFTQWKDDGRNRIYWGSASGFSEENVSVLKSNFTIGTAIVDLNRDGWLDIIFSNYNSDIAPIYLGGPGGFSEAPVHLPNPTNTNAVVAADLDNNGWLDLVLTTYSNKDGSNDGYTYIYWGGPDWYSTENSTRLPTLGAVHTTVADFNGDGWLDLCIANETTGERDRTWFAYIYWNGPEGFSPQRRTSLYTHGGAGSLALDFNRNGWLDLLLSNHKMSTGTHSTLSSLYWGGPDGFIPASKIEFLTHGANETTFHDAGHIYHRRFEIGFQSGIFDADREVSVNRLHWRADTHLASQILFQLRAAKSREELESASWRGPAGADSYFETPGPVPPLTGRYLQYRALFVSADGSNYPELHRVEVAYR